MRGSAGLGRIGWTVLVAAGLVVVAGIPVSASAAAKPAKSPKTAKPLRPESRTGIAGWRLVGHHTADTVKAGEGVTTVRPPGRRAKTTVVFRGIGTVPAAESAAGWTHIGDPDSTGGYVVDAFQGPSTRPSKMFLVTTPSGQTYRYVHTLVAGELYNNSFVALSLGGQWMVAGTWTTIQHLQIYPTPLLNHRTPRHGGTLRLAGAINLDHQVYYVQGCDFVTPTTLLCTSTGNTRYYTNAKPLLEIELSSPLRGRSVKGHVVDLGSIPEQSTCTGTFEAEGIDYDTTTGVLRVEIIQPGSCVLHTTVYEYKHARAG